MRKLWLCCPKSAEHNTNLSFCSWWHPRTPTDLWKTWAQMANDKTRDLPGSWVLISITVHSQLCFGRTAYVLCLIGIDKNNPQFLCDTVAKLRVRLPLALHSVLMISPHLPKNKTTSPCCSQNDGFEPALWWMQMLWLGPTSPSQLEVISPEALTSLVTASKPTTCILHPTAYCIGRSCINTYVLLNSSYDSYGCDLTAVKDWNS